MQCPYCFHEYEDELNIAHNPVEVKVCGYCGKLFYAYYERVVSIKVKTYRKEELGMTEE